MRVEPEEEEEGDYFQFKTFPRHIIYSFFNQRYLCPVQHKLKVIIKIFLKYTIMWAKPGPSLYTQYYRTV